MRHAPALTALLALVASDAAAERGGRHDDAAVYDDEYVDDEYVDDEYVDDDAEDREDADADDARVALAAAGDEDAAAADDDIEVFAREPAPAAPLPGWRLAVGPYLWAASVDTNISIGEANVSSAVDFMDLQKNARYGAEVLVEARHGRFSLAGDLMYGVVDVAGARTVGPLLVSVDGTASSLLVDAAGGVRLLGGEHTPFALEGRAGLRYQRTAIHADVGVDGSSVAAPTSVDAGADALAGARAFARPHRRVELVGAVDLGVLGTSERTWSASADASVRISRVMVSLGWRTLTLDGGDVSMVMHGPRAAIQLLF